LAKNKKRTRYKSISILQYGKTLIPILLVLFMLLIPLILIKAIYLDYESESKEDFSNPNQTPTTYAQDSNDVSESEPSDFWGNKINLNSPISTIQTEYPMDLWPAQYGFQVVKMDITQYKNREKNEQALKGIIVFIDPGHGGRDWGAIYPRSANPEFIESHINLAIANILRDQLEDIGAKVVLTRHDDALVRLFHRSAIVGKVTLEMFLAEIEKKSFAYPIISGYISEMEKTILSNDDKNSTDIFFGTGVNRSLKNILDIQSAYTNCIFISLHINSCEIPNTLHGAKVIYATNESIFLEESIMEHDRIQPAYRMYDDQNRKIISELIYNSIVESFPELEYIYPDQGVVEGNYSVIREQNLVGSLIELGYINHSKDQAILKNKDNQILLARAITDAIFKYYCED
jgi:N-acetylmuramoyl-L-alanine amidase